MFNTLKRELNIVDVVSYVTETEYKLTGENTWIPEGDECPSCGHKNCFRIKHEGTNEEAFAKCFSENETWDVTSLVAKLKDISNVEAAKLLAKHYNIKLPNDYSPLQEIMNLAAEYYHNALLNSGPHAELNGLTAKEYQEQIRQHTSESIEAFSIGWSDGGLIKYLDSLGISMELLADSGLVARKNADFLPAKTFIYPHFVRGRVSHFTFKDPLKQKAFQLQNKNKLNGHSYYNSDSISMEGPVAIVEGENDTISLAESSWDSGVICCNGSISGAQLDWLEVNLKDRDVVTFFDGDRAGDTYREKVAKISRNFKSLLQVKVTGQCKDIDEYLKKGGVLDTLIENTERELPRTSIHVDASEDGTSAGNPIVEKDGCYFRLSYKEGNEVLRQLSNFTVQLLCVYKSNMDGVERTEREVVFTMYNGKKTKPVQVSSDVKVSLKSFKVFLANAIEGSFYGNEADLASIWEHIFSKSTDKTVYLLNHVGRSEEYKGWVFRDCFIADSGALYYPDENGVMWITSSTSGIKPVSIISGERDNPIGVPTIMSTLSPEERTKLIGTVLKAISANIGDMGEALTILGYCWATVHSKTLFDHLRFFPHFQFWGIQGKGKTTLIKLMLSIFNMSDPAYTTISSLNSGVAFARKMSYYCSLPMCIDEIRGDSLTSDWYSSFRSWYDRSGKAIGTKEGSGIRVFPVNSTTIFGGEDLFSDPATRARCIPIRIRSNNRETVRSFKVMEEYWDELNAIGYEWILGYKDINKKKLIEELTAFERFLHTSGVDSRQARNWASVAIFSIRLAKDHCPEFNYMEWLAKTTKAEQISQKEDSTLSLFWEIVEGMQSMERSLFSSDHFKRDGNLFTVWLPEIFRSMGSEANKFKFSKNAILAAVREEDYFIKEGRAKLGMTGVYRRCVILDLEKCPDTLKTIAEFSER